MSILLEALLAYFVIPVIGANVCIAISDWNSERIRKGEQ